MPYLSLLKSVAITSFILVRIILFVRTRFESDRLLGMVGLECSFTETIVPNPSTD